MKQKKFKHHIDLHSSELDDIDMITLAIYLAHHEHEIYTLHLGKNEISDEGILNLIGVL